MAQRAGDMDEKELFVQSFQKAMDDVDARVKARPEIQSKAHKELVRMGGWNASWIASQYCLIAGKLCTLSARLRGYILALGAKAKEFYDKDKEEVKEND